MGVRMFGERLVNGGGRERMEGKMMKMDEGDSVDVIEGEGGKEKMGMGYMEAGEMNEG